MRHQGILPQYSEGCRRSADDALQCSAAYLDGIVVKPLLNVSKPETRVTAKRATRAMVIFGELRILRQIETGSGLSVQGKTEGLKKGNV